MSRLRHIATAALVSALGCAKPPPVDNPSPFDEDDPAALPAEPSPPPVVHAVEPEPDDPGPPDVIDREALHRVLAAGPSAYTGSVMIEAVVDAGELRGWRLTRWDVPWRGLERGEVVVDVNGTAIVRPDDLMELWDSLWNVSEIAIRVERDGAEEVRRFAVR